MTTYRYCIEVQVVVTFGTINHMASCDKVDVSVNGDAIGYLFRGRIDDKHNAPSWKVSFSLLKRFPEMQGKYGSNVNKLEQAKKLVCEIIELALHSKSLF